MVWPVVIAAGAAVASGLMQWRNSEAARRASREELARIDEMIAKMQDPAFDFRDINPAEFKAVGKYVPEVATFIAEKNPTLVQETADMRAGRGAQLEALKGLREAASGRDPAQMAMMDMAARRSQAEAQSRQASILQDAAQRGQSGSLATLAAQIGGAESSMQRNADMQRQAAIEAYRNRLNALQSSAGLGGDIRGQDIGLQQTNMAAINDFNRRAAQRGQDYAQYAADARNRGQLTNLGEAQRIADANATARYNAAVGNRDNWNRQQGAQWDAQLGKVAVATGQGERKIEQRTGQAQDQNEAIQGATNIFGSALSDYESRKKKQQEGGY